LAFPNPVESHLNLNIFSPEKKQSTFILRDQSGAIIRSETYELNEGANLIIFDADQLPKGVYILETYNGSKVQSKIIKQ
jgi:hypothetical protein